MLEPVAVAYIDPGSGSLLLQMIAGVFLGAIVALKLKWKQLKATLVDMKQRWSREDENA